MLFLHLRVEHYYRAGTNFWIRMSKKLKGRRVRKSEKEEKGEGIQSRAGEVEGREVKKKREKGRKRRKTGKKKKKKKKKKSLTEDRTTALQSSSFSRLFKAVVSCVSNSRLRALAGARFMISLRTSPLSSRFSTLTRLSAPSLNHRTPAKLGARAHLPTDGFGAAADSEPNSLRL